MKCYLLNGEQLVVCHPLHGQAEELLMKLEKNLLLLLQEDDLKRLGQVLMER